jgi:hypothetical protein
LVAIKDRTCTTTRRSISRQIIGPTTRRSIPPVTTSYGSFSTRDRRATIGSAEVWWFGALTTGTDGNPVHAAAHICFYLGKLATTPTSRRSTRHIVHRISSSAGTDNQALKVTF